MKKFNVICTMIHNGCVEVEAESEKEAYEKVDEMLTKDKNCANWVFGEITADYVEEIKIKNITMEKNRTEFVKDAYKNLVALYGKGNELFTFECCSQEGAMLDNSTIDAIRLEGDNVLFFYNANSGDYNYIEDFDLDELETFFLQLSTYYQKKKNYANNEMKVRITFRNEIYVEGKDMKDVRNIFECLDLGYDKLKEYGYNFVELCSVEDAETYEDLMSEWNNVK